MEERRPEPGAFDPLEKLLGDDLVGVDVDARQRRDDPGVGREGVSWKRSDGGRAQDAAVRTELRRSSRRHVRCRCRPVTAAAAAIAGLSRWVRPPFPWRPSKLRLEVEAQRSPAAPGCPGSCPGTWSNPAFRHSKPAVDEDPVQSLALGLGLHRHRARDHHRPDAGATPGGPRTTRAASRRSSIRALVQLPMKTRSTGIPSSGVPGVSPMYSSARAAASRSAGSGEAGRIGHPPVDSGRPSRDWYPRSPAVRWPRRRPRPRRS